MYIPDAFAVDDLRTLGALIADHGFATLVSAGADGLQATHVPVMYEPARGPQGTLVAHLARSNPHAAAMDGAAVLAIFSGPHGYISPSWYATHPSVPTWNYAVVHVHGRARLISDARRLDEIVRTLVEQYESGRTGRWSMDGLPDRYMHGMLNAIVGVEIEVEKIEGKHKLSQNRDAEDRRRVIAALGGSASPEDRALAAYMQRHAPPG
jgi:transcriptional regulator